MNKSPLLSIVIPLFNEQSTLERLFVRLTEISEQIRPTKVEFVFVDDHSVDGTFDVAQKLCRMHDNIKLIRLAQNSGSHAAICAGLSAASGDCAIFMAGDMQDPPELITEMISRWQAGNKIVWAARTVVEAQAPRDKFFSSFYWMIVHYLSGVDLPEGGVDFALMDRSVVDFVVQRWNKQTPIFLLIAESGLRSSVIFYKKAPRAGGKSGWTLKKKLRLVAQTLIYSFKPMRPLLFLGLKGVAPFEIERTYNAEGSLAR